MPTVEVFADVACPFTHVGLRRFVAERARRNRPDVHLLLRAWPLEVVNGEPTDAAMIAHEIEAIRGSVAPDLFAGFTVEAYPVTSIPALALAATAYDHDLALGEAVSLDLRDRLFEQGLDVSTASVLDAVAAAHGVARPTEAQGRARVLADHALGCGRAVVGSPHFFVGEASVFCPALSIHKEGEAFHIELDPAGFARLCDLAFS